MSINEVETLTFSGLELPSSKAEPFIKWAGGKQALLTQILPHFPAREKYQPVLRPESSCDFSSARPRDTRKPPA